MRIKVLQKFADRYKVGVNYEVGTTLEFDDERAKVAIAYGLAEEVKEVVKTKVEVPAEAEVKPKKRVKK